MAELLDPTEVMFTAFEPKVANRFIMYVEGIPSYLIKAASRPSLDQGEMILDHINVERKLKGKTRWQDVTITLYDPVVPSGAQAVMEWVRLHHESVTGRDGYSDFYKKDITFNTLGPVGDKVEEWTLKGSFISAATRNRFLSIVNPYFENVQQRQGLFAFKVVMDDSNNTPDVIDRNQMVGQIFLQPAKAAEFIIIDFNILPTGAAFPE